MTKKFLAALLMIGVMSSAAWCAVEINAMNFPDSVFREYVSQFDWDGDGMLSDEELASETFIGLDGNGNVSSLKGIEYFFNLESLHCDENQVAEVDLTRNPKLPAQDFRPKPQSTFGDYLCS